MLILAQFGGDLYYWIRVGLFVAGAVAILLLVLRALKIKLPDLVVNLAVVVGCVGLGLIALAILARMTGF